MRSPDYLENLNPQQLEAVTHYGTPLLILAGAGSGKTRVITTRIAYLCDVAGFDPRSILAVTFTNKAAREMAERAASLSSGTRGVMIRTFHSFGAWLLRRNAHLAGLKSGFTIYDDDDSLTLLHSTQDSRKKQDLKRYVRMISRAKDYALGPEDDLTTISSDPELPRLYRLYQERLDRMGNVDFGDLIMKPVRLLGEVEELRRRFHQRFKAVMVDEYQDSNVAQFKLLNALSGPDTDICVVGDEDQSIYRFRGAEVQNILNFSREFKGTRVIRLEENYRSTGTILAVASSVIANNQERLGKTLWTRNPEGGRARIVYLRDHDEEAEYCARLLGDRRYSDTAILYRTNAQSLAFESVFLRRGIPYRIVGSLRFYEREEVKDVLAFLAFISNSLDEVAFRRIVNKPARGIGNTTLQRILDQAEGDDLLSACEALLPSLGGRSAAGLAGFVDLFRRLQQMLESAPLAEVIELLIRDSGLYEYHQKQDEVAATQKTSNLEEMVNAAADYGRGPEALVSFLEDIELDRSRMTAEEESGEYVTLITMHNTKGLEFPRVIITGMEEELFPGNNGFREVDYEEERRIFYVSLTRAREELILTSCRSRFIWGRRNLQSPSCFLREIPQERVEVEGDEKPAASAALTYSPGDGVYHDAYGTGVVVKSWLNGERELIIVRFETGRSATFYPEFENHLERVYIDEF
ncbi:UvrD-helicase domain-containing protein [Marispirochaeta aestuarii]|uniref:ATP-dependent helicase n=1 Tax=Marispirochaeta aestuarii TaxID=1963862 RepID=UPI002ABD5197|nr:UvrD-helicase domain-containing protein [Marispirochaeta aestuarii]